MRSDAALDTEIKSLERQIHERRLMLRDSVDELGQAARMTRQRIRQRATSPLVWGGALVLGFIAARLAARRREEPERFMRGFTRRPPPRSPGRQVLGALLSAALPIALRVARSSATPWIARMLQTARENMARRRAYSRAYERY